MLGPTTLALLHSIPAPLPATAVLRAATRPAMRWLMHSSAIFNRIQRRVLIPLAISASTRWSGLRKTVGKPHASSALSWEFGGNGSLPSIRKAITSLTSTHRYTTPQRQSPFFPTAKIDPASGNPYNGLVRAGNGVPSDQTIRVPNVNTALFPLIPAGAPRGLYKMHGAFGPRFGFAYAADDNTVIRGGVGLFYYRPQGNLIFSQLAIPPFLQNTQFDTGNLATLTTGTANNTGTLAGINAIDPTNRNPYTWQYSVGVQRQMTRSVIFEMNYVGNVAHHQLRDAQHQFSRLGAGSCQRSRRQSHLFNQLFQPLQGLHLDRIQSI